MKRSKHTPGPWGLEIGKNACFHKGNRVSITKFTPASEAGEDCTTTVAEVWPTDGDQDIADGHLIAAAPDLLEACKRTLSDMVAEGLEDPLTDAWNALKGAIAKAEGVRT